MKAKLLFVALATLLLASGCSGFQLRGKTALPEKISPLLVTGINEYSDLYRHLRYQFGVQGVTVVSPGEVSGTIEKVTPETDEEEDEANPGPRDPGIDDNADQALSASGYHQLKLSNARSRNNLAALDNRGNALEYLLIERVDIELRDVSGEILIPQRTLVVDRYRYTRGAGQVAVDREKDESKQQMLETLAQEIVSNLHYGLRAGQ